MASLNVTSVKVGRLWLLACCFAVLIAAEVGAHRCYAVTLNSGSAIASVGEPKPSGGATTLASAALGFSAPTYQGTLTSTVLTNDATNPFGAGFLTFTYLVQNSAISLHELHRFTVSSFAGFNTNVSYSNLTAGVAPDFFDRSSGAGDVIGFTYLITPIVPNSASRLMVIQTNATQFQPTTASVIDGSVTTVASFAPLKLVPEPGTLALFGLGTLSMLAVAVRRRRARG